MLDSRFILRPKIGEQDNKKQCHPACPEQIGEWNVAELKDLHESVRVESKDYLSHQLRAISETESGAIPEFTIVR